MSSHKSCIVKPQIIWLGSPILALKQTMEAPRICGNMSSRFGVSTHNGTGNNDGHTGKHGQMEKWNKRNTIKQIQHKILTTQHENLMKIVILSYQKELKS